ncbi:MAG: hypothetical protein JOZ69_24530 [Myxococcales bacterium]|nr:hypothetical protein [Myxococcales bacterium]
MLSSFASLDKLARLRAAAGDLARAVRADRAMVQRAHEKYRGETSSAPLAADLVAKVGLQMMAAYRLMRFFSQIDMKPAAQVTSRVIRHLYGSDIHWDADFEPGVMLVHGMGMAISRSARVGSGATLSQHCTLGEGRHPDTAQVGGPTIEEGVMVGIGAVVIGPVTIGKRSKIMPGCVVVRSVPPDSIVEPPQSAVRPRAHADARAPNGGEAR